MRKKVKDICGFAYGKLTVVGFAYTDAKGSAYWHCKCACGGKKTVRGDHLRTGNTKSCGCLHLRWKPTTSVRRKTGVTFLPEYQIWAGIIQRCHNPENGKYEKYGAQGVQMCAEWRESFEAFYAYLGSRPTPSHSVDRINPFGNYEPGNVRWADKTTQSRNTRKAFLKGVAAGPGVSSNG